MRREIHYRVYFRASPSWAGPQNQEVSAIPKKSTPELARFKRKISIFPNFRQELPKNLVPIPLRLQLYEICLNRVTV